MRIANSKSLARAAALAALVVITGAPVSAADNAKPPAKPAVEDTGMMGTNSGESIYKQICAGCHMPDGRGAQGGGKYPAFVGNAGMASKQYIALTMLNGRRNMPAFSQPRKNEFYFPPVWLSDVQVANVVNYIRSNFGNNYPDPITADEVRALKPAEKGS